MVAWETTKVDRPRVMFYKIEICNKFASAKKCQKHHIGKRYEFKVEWKRKELYNPRERQLRTITTRQNHQQLEEVVT